MQRKPQESLHEEYPLCQLWKTLQDPPSATNPQQVAKLQWFRSISLLPQVSVATIPFWNGFQAAIIISEKLHDATPLCYGCIRMPFSMVSYICLGGQAKYTDKTLHQEDPAAVF